MRILYTFFISLILLVSNGCGYTTTALLPKDTNSIYVSNFENKIDPSRDVSDRRAFYSYLPGLENIITRTVVDKFIFDNNLEIKKEYNADLLLKGKLTDFKLSPLSYEGGGDSVAEYRVEVFVDIELYNNFEGTLMWQEKGFTGESSYTIAGPNSKTESEAIRDAVKDLAQRIVERTVEVW